MQFFAIISYGLFLRSTLLLKPKKNGLMLYFLLEMVKCFAT